MDLLKKYRKNRKYNKEQRAQRMRDNWKAQQERNIKWLEQRKEFEKNRKWEEYKYNKNKIDRINEQDSIYDRFANIAFFPY